MSKRNVMNVPTTDTFKDSDVSFYEQDNFVSAEVITLKKRLHSEPIFSTASQVYSGNNKGGRVSTRGEVYFTILSLFVASHGTPNEDSYLYLAVFDEATRFVNYGIMRINSISGVNVAILNLDGGSAIQFEEDDSTLFNAIVISPYGEIPGTESWTIV